MAEATREKNILAGEVIAINVRCEEVVSATKLYCIFFCLASHTDIISAAAYHRTAVRRQGLLLMLFLSVMLFDTNF